MRNVVLFISVVARRLVIVALMVPAAAAAPLTDPSDDQTCLDIPDAAAMAGAADVLAVWFEKETNGTIDVVIEVTDLEAMPPLSEDDQPDLIGEPRYLFMFDTAPPGEEADPAYYYLTGVQYDDEAGEWYAATVLMRRVSPSSGLGEDAIEAPFQMDATTDTIRIAQDRAFINATRAGTVITDGWGVASITCWSDYFPDSRHQAPAQDIYTFGTSTEEPANETDGDPAAEEPPEAANATAPPEPGQADAGKNQTTPGNATSDDQPPDAAPLETPPSGKETPYPAAPVALVLLAATHVMQRRGRLHPHAPGPFNGRKATAVPSQTPEMKNPRSAISPQRRKTIRDRRRTAFPLSIAQGVWTILAVGAIATLWRKGILEESTAMSLAGWNFLSMLALAVAIVVRAIMEHARQVGKGSIWLPVSVATTCVIISLGLVVTIGAASLGDAIVEGLP